MKSSLFITLLFISVLHAAPFRTYPGSAATDDESQDADVTSNRFEGVTDTFEPVSGRLKRLLGEREGVPADHTSNMRVRDDIHPREADQEEWNNAGKQEKRTCPHRLELDGEKRCIGNR